jgi:lipopolysaccharide export LptBFGC system permease protein LptF
MIQTQRFTQIEDRMIYVDSRDRDDRLEGVFISDRSVEHRPLLIFAEYGVFSYEPDLGQVQLRLENGAIHIEPKNWATDVTANRVNENEGRKKNLVSSNGGASQGGGYRKISFQTFDYAFEVDASMRAGLGQVRPKDMTMAELKSLIALGRAGASRRMLKRYGLREFEVQLHRRFAMPLAPIVFALIAVPLSLRQLKGVSSRGVIVCGVLCIIYYCSVMFFQYLAVQGVLPVILALWLPNVGLGAVGGALLMRARHVAI